jgi:hypothetical protein
MVKVDQRAESTGYYYAPPKIGRTHFSRYYYSQDTRPLIQGDHVPTHNYLPQYGGNILGYSLKYFVNVLAPLGKDRLMATIVLLVLNHFKKFNKQTGGSISYLSMAEKTLAPLGKNMLVVIGALLLMDYFVRNKKLIGGNNQSSDIFSKKITELLKSKYKQSGGSLLVELGKVVIPSGINAFKATTLLILLDKLFTSGNQKQKQTQKQSGGCQLMNILRQLVMPLGVNQFLTSLGLIALTKTDIKYKKYLQKGGDCGCGVIKKLSSNKQMGGNLFGPDFGSNNCNCSSNTLEIVGDTALNYSNNLQQFGYKIPEWGSNLVVEGQGKCL